MIKFMAIFVTSIFIICFIVMIVEFLFKKWFKSQGLEPDFLKSNIYLYNLFFASKCIGVITLIGMVILWILYTIQPSDIDPTKYK